MDMCLGLGTELEIKVKKKKKRLYKEVPSYFKSDKIKQDIQEWNTIKHIYRYQTLYKIYSKIYFLTYNNKLSCLDYFNDIERDGSKTYTIKYAVVKNTMALSLEKRIKLHIELLRKIKNNDKSLKYDNNNQVNVEAIDDSGSLQMSLF